VSVPDRGLATRGLALLYLLAGVVGLLNCVLPGSPNVAGLGLLGISAFGLVMPLLILGLGERMPQWAFHALVAAGSASIGGAIVITGGAPNAATMLYVWVAIYACYFFSPRAASAHLAFVAAGFALVVIDQHAVHSPAGTWVTTVATTSVAGACVGLLRARLDRTFGRLRRLADTDTLTGLANRRGWMQGAEDAVRDAALSAMPLSIVALDIDGFKPFNDEHGHEAGDRLLVECARAWEAAIRRVDLPGRLGGDEFVVLAPQCDERAAEELARRLRAVTPTPGGCSAGVAQWVAGESLDDTLRRADGALYADKRRRRAALAA
jgi:diguanylate cyclase (GGDEF)-like protein